MYVPQLANLPRGSERSDLRAGAELPNGISGGTIDRIITLTPGSYNAQTLQAELQSKLRRGTSIGSGQYIVSLADGVFTIGHTSLQASGLAFIYSKENT